MTPVMRLIFEVSDACSDVRAVEVAIDADKYTPYAGPFTLSAGDHEVR